MDDQYCSKENRRTCASFLVALALTAYAAAISASPAGPPSRPAQPPPPDSSLAAHTYTQAPAPSSYVTQPLSGIAPYFSPGINYSSYFPSPLMWSYFGLSEVMTDPNDCTKFNWTIFDEALDESAVWGRQMVFRFYLEYPGGTGSHPANATPQCLINQGVTMQTNPYWGSVHPVWDDSRTIQTLENFIKAFAARYDTNGPNGGPDPRIAHMTAGLIGLWGEWHEWPYDGVTNTPNMMASAATVQAIVSTYSQAFHNIQVEIRYPYLAGVAADTTMGLHDDSWDYRESNNGVLCGDTLPQSLGGCSYSFLQYELNYGLENRWITQSIGGEARPEIQNSIYTNWPSGSGQVDNPKAATELSHVTWLINQTGAQGGYSPTDANIIAGVGEMGYKFYVPQANFNNSVSGSFNVGVTIENLGVAPFYYPWTVVLALLDGSGKVVQTWNTNWDLRTAQPLTIRAFPDWNVGADPTYIPYGWPMNFETNISATGVAAGTYTLAMRVVNPLETVTQAILESRGPAEGLPSSIPQNYYRPPAPFYFWNASFNNGWLQLGTISVTTASGTTVSVEAEGPGNVLAGGAVVQSCSGCSGGNAVGYIGNNSGTLTINLSVPTAGSYTLTTAYVNGDPAARTAQITVDSGTPQTVSFAPTGSWSTPNNLTLSSPITLNAGSNVIEFSNSSSWAPDIDKIAVTTTTTVSMEAEGPGNILAGGAVVQACSGCSGGKAVGYIGNNSAALTINLSVPTAGSYTLTTAYVNGDPAARTAQITVDSGTPQTVSFAPTGSWSTPNNLTLSSPIRLNAGSNMIEFSNSSSWAPDIDKITVALP